MVGNISNFSKIDILRCFLRFNKNAARQELARELDVGEGTIRTILDILKSKNLLSSTKKGHFLNKSAKKILDGIYESISVPKNLLVDDIYPGLKKVGVLVKDPMPLKQIYLLRDAAVKHGADGAIILKFEDKLYAPDSDYNKDYSDLEKYFDFKKDNILIIAFSKDNKSAETGALAIAIELSNNLKNFMSGF